MFTLVLLRHGQSQWSVEKKFTGWADSPLSEAGEAEARSGGKKLREAGLIFDEVYTNYLKRCIKTTWIALEELDLMWIPVHTTWRLNERFYGALIGLNKQEVANQYGEEQVKIWRRSFDMPPPALTKDDPRYPGHDPRYAGLSESELPLTESLKDTIARVLPYWNDVLAPAIRLGKRIMISASGNSLRSIVKHLDEMSEEAIVELEIPTGIPLVYELDENLKPIKHYYLATDEELEAALERSKSIGKK